MEVIECIEQNDYVKFFETLDRKTYVQACLLSLYVNRVRSVAVKLFLKVDYFHRRPILHNSEHSKSSPNASLAAKAVNTFYFSFL